MYVIRFKGDRASTLRNDGERVRLTEVPSIELDKAMILHLDNGSPFYRVSTSVRRFEKVDRDTFPTTMEKTYQVIQDRRNSQEWYEREDY